MVVKPASRVFFAFATPTTVQKLSVNVARIRSDVRVHVDQARQQRHARQFDAAGAGWNGGALGRDRGDAAVDDGDLRTIDDAAGEHVDHPIGGYHDGIGMRRRSGGAAQEYAGCHAADRRAAGHDPGERGLLRCHSGSFLLGEPTMIPAAPARRPATVRPGAAVRRR
jgi:hypothetical protein